MNINKLFDLSDKVVIITGAAGLLGTQYAYGLSQAGANVVLADIDLKKCKSTEKEIKRKFHTTPMSLKLDLTKPKSISSMTTSVIKKFSKIDVLVNNAAYQGNTKIRNQGFENLKLNDWNQALNVNLTGVFLCCQNIGKQMLKQKSGNIINIASTYGLVGADQRIYGKSGQNSAAFYAATKSAVVNLTRYLAAYWQKTGIRVNTLSPGGVQNNQEKNFQKKYSEKTILGRMANKNEYNGALLFLVSDASSYMTGTNLVIDGGWTAW